MLLFRPCLKEFRLFLFNLYFSEIVFGLFMSFHTKLQLFLSQVLLLVRSIALADTLARVM